FARFYTGNFDVKDEPRSGQSITEKSDEIMEEVERDKHVSTVEIARELNIDHKTILNHLHKAGYWVPHELSVKNMMDRINICDLLSPDQTINSELYYIYIYMYISIYIYIYRMP
ncbi:SETMR methyltransferase, partial [Acromyrmex insinuator]